MKNESTNRLMTILINLSLVIFVLGGLFQIQHWPYGKVISTVGLLSYLVISQVEIIRLKKVITNLTKEEV
jgi:hypothetical protein